MPKVVKRRVRSQSYGSLGDLRKSLKRSGGGASGKIGFIPEDPITCRFLSEPETWIGYHEHYNGPNADPRYSPCVDGECCLPENLYQGNKPTFRYLANAYNVDQSKVQALKMPKSLVEQLVKFYEKYGTILDRDYELSRSGSGMDTSYSAVPDDKSPIKISRFRKDMVDLEQLLEDWASEQEEEDDDEEEVSPRRRRRPEPEDDDDYDDDEEDDDDDPPSVPVRRRKPAASSFKPKRRPVSTKGVEDEDDEPPKRPTRKVAAKKTVAKPVAAKRTIRRTR
ncbi:hypothetical protein [Streptomyces sp. NPDC006477]|uniref:hypothetical protein n=1 Tax=Streptomyces sp. NPDC006477 TaxID=3364747 RepID=UPI0036B64F0F